MPINIATFGLGVLVGTLLSIGILGITHIASGNSSEENDIEY